MRKDIVIEVSVPNESYEQWEQVDISKDQKMTLQFISNLLTGVDSITSSSTLSVKLPRTAHNERIFDFATRPQYESTMTHRKIPCHVYINGMDMMRAAYCYLLDSESDSYEVCIVFGLLTNYGAWIDAGRSIKQLADTGQSIPWDWRAAFYDIYVPAGSTHDIYDNPPVWYGDDPNINTYTPQNGLGRLMYYGIYTPGFERTDNLVNYANVHPFVTLREIWERIISENNLNFVLPIDVKRDMENLAIVLTSIKGNAAQGTPNIDNNASTTRPQTIRLSSALSFGWNIICDTIGDCYQNGNPYGVKGKILANGDGNAVDLQINMLLDDSSSFPYNGSNRSASYILNDVGHMEYLDLCVYLYATQQTVKLTPTYTPIGIQWQGTIHVPSFSIFGSVHEGDAIADIWIDNDGRICNYCSGAFNNYWMGNRSGWDALFKWAICSVGVVYYTGSQIYPHPRFRCFPNLPDIKQLDFVKMICQLYCLFPVVNSGDTEQVDFVHFDVLDEAAIKGPDWSDKLLERMRDVPHKISYRLGDYARRNIIQYKEDEKDPVLDRIRTGSLNIDDHTLDREKELITYPLAASEGDYIGQYNIISTEDESDPPIVTYEAEFTECVHRLMRVVEWLDPIHKKVTRLDFSDLSVPYILQTYYATYQAAIAKPRIITERIRLNELEMRDVDFRLPVYLRKYGRFYAIKQIQWTVGDEYAEVELLQLA